MTTTQLKHRLRLIKQFFVYNPIGIIGGYHGGNLGDIALGLSIKNYLSGSYKRKGVLQTIYSLNRLPWRKHEFAILGGGAIGYNDSLKGVYQKYQDNLKCLAVIGVDFNDKFYDANSINLLKEVTWLSCRNEQQKFILENLTGRNDISFHPDLAFSLYNEFCRDTRIAGKKEKLVLINVVPLYSSFKDGVLTPSLQYEHERPELYKNYSMFIESYIKGVKAVVKDYSERGYRIESIPFTPQDDEMARYIFPNNEIHFNAYTDLPKKMLKKMAKAEVVFATRYHATIFSLKLGSKLIPLAYAKKNEELFNELGIKKNEYLTSTDLANGIKAFKQPLYINNEIITQWEDKMEHSLDQCFTKLGIAHRH